MIMDKPIIEIEFNPKFNLDFAKNCSEFLDIIKKKADRQNIDEICIVYFHTGKNIDYLTSYQYVKYVEDHFKININFIDISDFYQCFQKVNQSNQFIKFKEDDIDKMIKKIKEMYIFSINNYLNKGK